jgi:protein gp37
MGENSKIEWCDHSWNPWIGCSKVSPGCANCYAEAFDHRFGGGHWGPGAPRRRTSEANWRKPLAWNRKAAELGTRPRVFCASLADVFDPEVPREWRSDLLALINKCPHLDWLLLTKRPELVNPLLGEASNGTYAPIPRSVERTGCWNLAEHAPNIWLGTTIENQEQADKRIPQLLAIPAARRFLSCEPLLGPVDLTDTLFMCGRHNEPFGSHCNPDCPSALNWVIVGGESGAKARPMALGWAKDIVADCDMASVPVFVKQMGDNPTNREGEPCPHITAPKGKDMSEWPVELRRQEVPA